MVKPEAASVWGVLSAQNVNDHTEQKGGFTYLAWTWAWAVVKQHYPQATYTMGDDKLYLDGSMEVRTKVAIEGLELPMWLPVTDHKNRAIAHPDAFSINTARMRCLVKNLAMFGLGHYIYAGEALPKAASATDAQYGQLVSLVSAGDGVELRWFCESAGPEVMAELFNQSEPGKKTAFKADFREVYKKGIDLIRNYAEQIAELLGDADVEANPDDIFALIDEANEKEMYYIKNALSETKKFQLEAILEAR